MPELPEVETIKRQLADELVGLEIKGVVCKDERLLQPDTQTVGRAVVEAVFKDVDRTAKLLIFTLAKEGETFYLLCHLRMSGRLFFRNQSDPEDDYVGVTIKLSQGKELRFASARKFGYIRLADEQEMQETLKKYGPEPLDDLTFEKFKNILADTRAMVKTVLMDQKRIAGVGNIYANDALFLAEINPETPANKLSAGEKETLYNALEQVLKEGLDTEGASDQWYRNAYGGKGSYQEHFKVYGKAGESCPECGGTIKRIKVGGRGTFICPNCQKKST
ncbi:MAG: bifunctional DNA-formamidopyrimidine glycosylase/DNA-(apurinic or apyrimidinic site) lyase [Patescibacteria group bacterium]